MEVRGGVVSVCGAGPCAAVDNVIDAVLTCVGLILNEDTVASDDDDFGIEHAFQGGGWVFDDTDSEESVGHAPAEDPDNAFQDGIRGLFGGDAEKAGLACVDFD